MKFDRSTIFFFSSGAFIKLPSGGLSACAFLSLFHSGRADWQQEGELKFFVPKGGCRKCNKEQEKRVLPTDYAGDRLAHILRGGNNETTGQQQDRREDVVKAKDGVVRLNLLVLEVIL